MKEILKEVISTTSFHFCLDIDSMILHRQDINGNLNLCQVPGSTLSPLNVR